jgi:hypothetical protein
VTGVPTAVRRPPTRDGHLLPLERRQVVVVTAAGRAEVT